MGALLLKTSIKRLFCELIIIVSVIIGSQNYKIGFDRADGLREKVATFSISTKKSLLKIAPSRYGLGAIDY